MATEDFVDQEPPFLQQVYSPHYEIPNIDLVFVHGLNPFGHKDHAFRTWTYVNNTSKVLWPQKLLPQDFPTARVLIFGYNSNISKGVSEANISDHAYSLLDALKGKRQENSKIPIIFLGHSLGGLVIKQALLNAKGNDHFNPIYEATFGLVFFGTPHRGGNTGVAAALAAGTAKLFANDGADNNLLMCLKPDSLFTQESSERFSEQLGKYRILTFFETIPIKFHGINKIVVSRHSAILGAPREKRVDLNRNHSEICKFADRGNAYGIFRANLNLLMAEALDLMEKSSPSSDTPRTLTLTSVDETQLTENTTSSFKKDEELSTMAQSSRQNHEAVLFPFNSGDTTNQEALPETHRGLHPGIQSVSTRPALRIASNQSNPQMTSQDNIIKDNYTPSSKYYTSRASVSELNDQFLQAARDIDTPKIHNWIKDPTRRSKLYSQHVNTALLSLAGFKEGKDPRFRTHAVSVILDECNPDVECRDEVYEATPLMLAACGGRDAIVLLLINKGASLKATDNKCGRTALTWAARSNAFVTAEIILGALEKNQDRQTIKYTDKNGLTALYFASQRKYERMIKLLKSHGAIE